MAPLVHIAAQSLRQPIHPTSCQQNVRNGGLSGTTDWVVIAKHRFGSLADASIDSVIANTKASLVRINEY